MRGLVDAVARERAIDLRKRGYSIRTIEKQIGINRSTLGGWFRNIHLSKKKRERLHRAWKRALVTARMKAVLWHNEQKRKRLAEAESEAAKTLSRIDIKDIDIVDLAFAALYYGEGSKKNVETGIGSSDPLILRFSLAVLKKVYNLNLASIRCELYLRADQKPKKEIRYWSRELGLSESQFKQINIDRRTEGKKTFENYHGVCGLRCGHVAIQRKLVYLSQAFFKEIGSTYLRP